MNYTERYNVDPLIPLPEYLFHRLNQLNCNTVFGTPDRSTGKLYPYMKRTGLKWIQTINQLNSSFVTDAYARLMGIGCYVTSESAELGHINGFFGSFCEYVPILQIVVLEQSHDIERLISDVCIFHGILDDSSEIDQCLYTLYWGKRPVYLGLRPQDLSKLIPSITLNDDVLNYSFATGPRADILIEDKISGLIDKILLKLYNSSSPLIVVDGLIDRFGYNTILEDFFRRSGIPFVTTPMSKASIDESLDGFVGTFLGTMSQPMVREYMDNGDCILILGCMIDNFKNSYCKFTYKGGNQIMVWNDRVKLNNKIIPDIPIHKILPRLISSIDVTKFTGIQPIKLPDMLPRVQPQPVTFLRQEYLWYKISTWLQEGDVVISESGTSSIGLLQQKFPNNTRFVSQQLWNSSGYSVGACLGVMAALKDLKVLHEHRVILMVGDGSLQFTFQELSTILNHGFKPYMFIINNQGYTVDRSLNKDKTHLNATYFDIQQWDFSRIPRLFQCFDYYKKKCISVGELNDLLSDDQFNYSDKFKLVELILPSMDVPIHFDKDQDTSDDESSTSASKRRRT